MNGACNKAIRLWVAQLFTYYGASRFLTFLAVARRQVEKPPPQRKLDTTGDTAFVK